MIAIVDYGVGNLYSLRSSLKYLGVESIVTGDASEIRRADKVILPGVGAFEDAANSLVRCGLKDVIIDESLNGKPLLGICLGMQMLFDESHEFGLHKGLSLIAGKVISMKDKIPESYKIPHMGWNKLCFPDNMNRNILFDGVGDEPYVYFVHSFYASECNKNVIAYTEYGIDITAAVAEKNIYGCQFHPEKSGMTGLKILKNFCEKG